MRFEVCFSGKGGQGNILAGIILAEAAGIYDGKNVSQTQSYGPEARGGASRSQVIISDDEIFFPEVLNLDVLVCLSEKAYVDYAGQLTDDKVLIYDSQFVTPDSRFKKSYGIPFMLTAQEQCGTQVVANIICLGAFTAISDYVSYDSVKQAVLKRVPKGTEELNEKALQIGFDEGKKLLK